MPMFIRNSHTCTVAIGCSFLYFSLQKSLLAYSIGNVFGAPDNHEYSARQACQVVPDCIESAIVEGVREPDVQDAIPWQMGFQRVFSLDGQLRAVSEKRARIQHIHANPLPLEKLSYEKALSLQYLPIDVSKTFPFSIVSSLGESSRRDVWARVTMGQLRNKMLAQTASWMCTGLAHPQKEQKWRKFGNLAHMIGDSYSASHTWRREEDPKHLLLSFSMDTVMWKKHIVGDAESSDFRFQALTEELQELARLYQDAITKVESVTEGNQEELLSTLAQVQDPIFDRLCQQVWFMDDATLRRPAGGSTKEWSASLNQGKSILPSGFAPNASVEEYVVSLQKKNPQYFYPVRHSVDFCIYREVLRCDWKTEVAPSLIASPAVETMFVPEVNRSQSMP